MHSMYIWTQHDKILVTTVRTILLRQIIW